MFFPAVVLGLIVALMERTIIFVTGDHGEEFGEHGQRWHGTNLYQAQVRPAALLYAPGLAPRRISAPATFTDVPSSIANLLRLKEVFSGLRNRNLAPTLLGGEVDPGRIWDLIENFQFAGGRRKNYTLALVRWPEKLIDTEEGQRFELYDIERDPNEQHGMSAAGGRARAIRHEIFEYLDASTVRHPQGVW